MSKVLERFLEYIKFDTTSDPNSGLHPSSNSEFELLDYLEKEMKSIGFEDIYKSDKCYIYGVLKANSNDFKPVGFIAHIDTSSDASGKNIKPVFHEKYDGKDIILNENTTMKVSEFPFLKMLKGRTLVTTDGTTLLGGDDKAGIATILEACDIIKHDKSFMHGDIYVAFTPDEEIGEGTDYFELDKMPVSYAYTVDGGIEGQICYENFNAASCLVTINGLNIHPGSAKGHMKNSLLIACEFNSMLDPSKTPQHTENYEGFNHLNNMEGNVEKTTMHYIIRNHDMKLFNAQKAEFNNIAEFLNKKYGDKTVNINIQDSYFNMYEIIKDKMDVVNIAKEATIDAGIEPMIMPIRGGTDGATLTFKGLPCPNLGTGGFNCHGRYEFVTLEGLESVVKIIINIVRKVNK